MANRFEVKWDNTVGRHLVASTTIFPGEVIIDENAIIHGPSPSCPTMLNGSGSICTICYTPFLEDADTKSSSHCSKCFLPLCSVVCAQMDRHEMECKIFSNLPQLRNILKKDLYQFINVIRCLLTRYQDSIKWKQIKELQSQGEKLPKDNALAIAFELVSWNLLRSAVISEGIEDNTSDAELSIVQAACHCLGVLRTNSFSELRKDKCVENLYFFSSFMTHSCYMNTDRQFYPNSSRVIVRAARKIVPGEPITNTYVPFLSCAIQRVRQLAPRGFSCKCARCLDPTEFETFFSAIKCCKLCSISMVVRQDSGWQCLTCNQLLSHQESLSIASRLNAIEAEIETVDITCLAEWLERVKKEDLLSSNHAFIIEVKYRLCQIQANCDDLEEIANRVKYAEEVLFVFDRLFPGLFLFKGRVLFHYWLNVETLERLQTDDLGQDQITTKLSSSKSYQLARNAYEVLRLGIPGSDEYIMNRIIIDEYPEFEKE